jgi:glycosyltransferase involved in cell wall biosynthesis
MKKIGAVIPAWNEEQDIPLVLNTVGPVKWLSEIVVIDDGSIDNTLAVAQECAGKYRHMVVEQLAENKGKGAAMLAGVRALDEDIEIVIFLDADLYGFTADHLAKLRDPVVSQRCDMTVAGFRKGRWRTDLSQRFTPNLSGQRCLPRKAVEQALPPLADSGYGVEIGLTLYGRRHKWRVEYVIWEGASHDMKEGKLGLLEGSKIRTMMYQQILDTWFQEWWKNRRQRI